MSRAVKRAMQVLESLGQARDGLTHSQISGPLNIPKSSVTAILGDLLYLDFILFDASNKKYSLGPRIISLAYNYLDGYDLIKTGAPIVKSLAEKTGESAAIYIQSGTECQLVYKEDVVLRMLKIGARAPMFAMSSGKVLLAYRSDSEIEAYLHSVEFKKFTRYTVTSPANLLKELQKIKASGLGYNREEYDKGILGISAPVFERHGEIVAALTLVAPTFRVKEKRRRLIERVLSAEALRFSHLLGFNDGFRKKMP